MSRRAREPKPQTRVEKVDAMVLDFLDENLPLSRGVVVNMYSDRVDRDFVKERLLVLEELGRVVVVPGDRLLRAATRTRG